MNLTPTRKKLLFAGLVVVFVIIGLAITWPQGNGRTGAAPSPSPSASASTSTTPVPTASVDPAKFDIYKLLPFGKQEFVAAATTAQTFVAAYGTYRYDESPQVYTDGLKALSTGDFAKSLSGAAGGGMGGQDLKTNQTVSKGSATIARLRDFGASSIIFIVNAHQDITGKNGSNTEDAQYAVTVTGSGDNWQVYDFQPASAGDSGG